MRSAARRGYGLEFLANRELGLGGGRRATVVTGHTVDEEIVARVAEMAIRDIPVLVVTRDIPLAEAVLNAGGHAMNDRGTVFDAASIAERRSLRDAAAVIRAAGLESMSRRREFGPRERKAFADALDRVLTSLGT